jgi:hypothetical protein
VQVGRANRTHRRDAAYRPANSERLSMFGLFRKKENLFRHPPSEAAGSLLAKASARALAKQAQWEADACPREASKWGFGQDTGVLTFQHGPSSTQEYRAQVLGSYHAKRKEWQWAWDNPNVDKELTGISSHLRELGSQNGLRFLSEGKVHIPDESALIFLISVCVGLTDAMASFDAAVGDLTVVFAIERKL